MARAAQREFQILEGIDHAGILRAVDYHEHELGPALVFEHDPKALRLDHFLIEHGDRLDVDLRLGLLRQVAEALQYAHDKRAPADRFRAGTMPYLDPFLSPRRPPRWDLGAERFAAAMTLYEMATGTLPKWGDGKSDPAVLDCEVTVDTELFEASLREPLTKFFGKALRRDFRARFDNAEEMVHGWRRVFEQVDRPTITTDHMGEADVDSAIASATLETPLVTLGLSTRAINALERVSALDVQALLRLPVTQISHMRGVGHKTRREVLDAMRKLAARFPRSPHRLRLRAPHGDRPGVPAVRRSRDRQAPGRPSSSTSANAPSTPSTALT